MAKEITELQMVGLVRNALLVAGYEMGQTGDHWPVINSTIHEIARDWEESKIEDNVDAELKIHLYGQIDIMEKNLASYDTDTRMQVAPKLKELREICDAYFCACDETLNSDYEQLIPIHVKRAEAIINNLYGDKND